MPDYTLYKLERHARRKSQQENETWSDEAMVRCSQEEPLHHDSMRRSSSISGSDASPNAQRPKGILKPPTVRFKVSEEAKDHEEFSPPLFPPPPPPPLPPNSRGFAGPRPVLYDTMQPLPPGPPQGLNLLASGPEGAPRIDPAAYSLYIKFFDELDEFVSMQGNVIKSRVQVQERRTKLKLCRENVSRCDIEFMDYLRQCRAKGAMFDDPKLKKLFDASQAARDEVGPEEDDYEGLENKLGAEEFALKEKYNALETRFENFFKLRATSTTNQTIPSTIEFEPSSAASESERRLREEEEPRQYSLFQGAFVGANVKIGQLPLAGSPDGFGDAVRGMKSLVSPVDRIPPSGPQMSSDSPEAGRRNASISSNAPAEGELQFPRDLFDSAPETAEGFVPESESTETRMNFSLSGLGDLTPIAEDYERLLDDLDVEYSFGDGDSLLLLGTDSDTQSTLSDYLIQFESTRNRVNRWLLHKLRVSPLEVFEFRRQVLESSERIPDWANLALRLWEGDSTEIEPQDATHSFQNAAAPYPSTKDLPRRHRWRKKARHSPGANKATLAAVHDSDHGLIAFDPATQRYEAI